jgi:pimeloyl-ACP methyl ester carboxylesterase
MLDDCNDAPMGNPAAVKGEPRWLQHFSRPVAWVMLHPLRLPPVLTPRLAGLPYRALELESGTARLAAWHIPAQGARSALILCHGHNNSRGQFFPLLRCLHEAGHHLLLFDNRSHGLSSGPHCTYGYYEQVDVGAAVTWVRNQLPGTAERIGLLGYSMGGAAALLAMAADPGVACAVTDCAFARMGDLVPRRLCWVPSRWRAGAGIAVQQWGARWSGARVEAVDPEAALRRAPRRPHLIIHGEHDRVVPPEHAHRLAAAGGGELWLVPGAGHVACRRYADSEYRRRVLGFLARHLG